MDRDDVEGPMVLMNSAPIRPMTYDPNGHLWVVNHPANTVERFVGAQTTPVAVHPVPWGPVSVAAYKTDRGDVEILCVTRNTWALTRLDAASGAVLDVVPLDAEPGDVLVDQDEDRAFVSCMGGDSVAQIDLSRYDSAPERVYHHSTHPSFLIKSPLFMSFDSSGRVLVAPLHSGNNTTARGPDIPTGHDEVIDLYDTANVMPGEPGLPDEDLFVIDPDAGVNGTVTAVGRRMGTILFAHGTHPNGDFWQLNTDAVNGDSTAQSEPLVRGHFANNQVTIVPTPFGTPTQADPAMHYKSLDPGPSFTPTTTIAQPFALAFHSNGKAFVCGLGSDNVAILNADGSLFKEWDLPDGSIPRGLVVHPAGSVILVYCFGTNQVRTYRWANNPPSPLITYQLSYDPTPALLKEGRAIFFDSGNSEEQNLSCATCHIDGGSDMLAWNLSNMPKDDKGPMVTQTLVGLDRLAPFHWRGEREFVDFNGAFDGLLGNSTGKLPDADFDKMAAYIFALKNPANPFQNRERVVDSSIQHITNPPPGAVVPVGDAVQGQIDFRTEMTFAGEFTCNTCHAQPTGSNNAIIVDFQSLPTGERTHLKVAPFHEVWRRQQRIVDLKFIGKNGMEGQHRRSFIGVGTAHSGAMPDLFEFVQAVPAGAALGNIASFVHQWDQGLGQAVHSTFLLNAMTVGSAATELQSFLEKQANARKCDLTAFGTVSVLGTPTLVRWNFDRWDTTGRPFKPDQPGIADRSSADFIAAAASEPHVFVGVPVGMGEAFSVDLDRDDIWNGTDPNPIAPQTNAGDTVAPSILAGSPSFLWTTTRASRLRVDTDEPSTVSVRYWETTNPNAVRTTQSDVFGKTHAIVLTGLRASTAMAGLNSEFVAEDVKYDVEVTVTDRANNASMQLIPAAIQTDPHILPDMGFTPSTSELDRMLLHEHRVAYLAMDDLTVSGSGVHTRVVAATAFTHGPPTRARDRVIVARVLKVPAGGHLGTIVSAADLVAGSGCIEVADFTIAGGGPAHLNADGPYLVSSAVTDASGAVFMEFDVGNVALGETIQFNIEAVVEIPDANLSAFAAEVANCAGNPACSFVLPVASSRSYAQWDFPASKEANTCVSKKL